MSMFLDCESCPSFVMWAFSDNDSWIPEHTGGTAGQACIYNVKYQPKPAYYALLDTLKVRNGVPVGTISLPYNSFSVFPTLVDDHFVVVSETGSDEFAEAVITNMAGQQVARLQRIKTGESIPVTGLGKGMYVLSLTDRKGKLHMIKFLKQ
jgi:hypothetical protein